MAFGNFTYPEVFAQLNLTFDNTEDLFPGVPAVPANAMLCQWLPITTSLATTLNTEKARSEWMVAPVLADFWSRYHGRIGLYSGVTFNADEDAGLNGWCDYLISRSPQQMVITPPVLVAFEAKNESIPGGLGQCVAAMVGAQRYNRRHGAPTTPIYGCVTTGTAWRFLRLEGNTITLSLREYVISEADLLIGILIHIVGPPPAPAVAA
ncbi:MAG: hypothetical protein U0792_11600 [Gemmataceae bacterium]